MKRPISFFSCCFILVVLLSYRLFYSGVFNSECRLNITQWDAFGYYQYLPAFFIYHDYEKLEWVPSIDRQYNVTGGGGLPVQQLDNGNKVCKYLAGVAILELPFFAIGHAIAHCSHYPMDGFSAPYQYSLALGALLYSFLALIFLRQVLLRYFNDRVTAATLILITLATNFVQYAAVHSGLSHVWIFAVYPVLLYTIIKWHEAPKAIWALLIGLLIGLSTICRPTEAIALFLPLLWQLHNKKASRNKWRLVRRHPQHVALAIIGGIAGITPQLLYWKSVSGSFVYDVGSKWQFFNPWFRVLFGWEKGWFIYTPITILFVVGLLLIRRYPFRIAVLIFCLLNVWIVISWDDWHYGASYSCRALIQSYPIFALPLAAVLQKMATWRFRILFIPAAIFLIGTNLFQVLQYNSNILHYDEMNRQYYGRIFLNPYPTSLDMSLLDTDEWLSSEKPYKKYLISYRSGVILNIPGGNDTLMNLILPSANERSPEWLRIDARIVVPGYTYQSRLMATLQAHDSSKTRNVRLDNPVGESTGRYAFYLRVPPDLPRARLIIFTSSARAMKGFVESISIIGYCKLAY